MDKDIIIAYLCEHKISLKGNTSEVERLIDNAVENSVHVKHLEKIISSLYLEERRNISSEIKQKLSLFLSNPNGIYTPGRYSIPKGKELQEKVVICDIPTWVRDEYLWSRKHGFLKNLQENLRAIHEMHENTYKELIGYENENLKSIVSDYRTLLEIYKKQMDNVETYLLSPSTKKDICTEWIAQFQYYPFIHSKQRKMKLSVHHLERDSRIKAYEKYVNRSERSTAWEGAFQIIKKEHSRTNLVMCYNDILIGERDLNSSSTFDIID